MFKTYLRNLLKIGIVFLVIFGLTMSAQLQEAKVSEPEYSTAEKLIIEQMKKTYIITNSTEKKTVSDDLSPPVLKIISPADRGRIFTNKNQTHVTITIETMDQHSGIKTVCGAWISNNLPLIFVEDEDNLPPYRLVFEKIPTGEQKFMVFSVNNAGLFKSTTMTLNVKKITTYKIVPKS